MTLYGPVKPHGEFKLEPDDWRRLDTPRITPTHGGRIDWELYLNIRYRLLDPHKPGIVRAKVVRAAWRGQPEDPTDYGHVPLLPGLEAEWLPWTHLGWEVAEAGRPTWVELQVEHARLTIGTRYWKGIQ
jgi:hypothetical protein